MVSLEKIASLILSPDASIQDAAKILQGQEIKIVLVCAPDRRLLGTVTDGDIRRAVGEGRDLSATVAKSMNQFPKTTGNHSNPDELADYMRREVVRHLPELDSEGRVVNVFVLDGLENPSAKDSAVVLMAGGEGLRLRPLTENTPKPLLKVGNKPVLERQIEHLRSQGFRRFYLSINYLGHMIEDYFGDGGVWDVQISYLKESKPLGTAGALSLLEPQSRPFIVCNGDIITKTSFGNMLTCFEEDNVHGTIGVREFSNTVPYGCGQLKDGRIVSIREKPTFRHLINAGVYVLAPDVLKLVPEDEYYDMPSVFIDLIRRGLPTNVYQITEEWVDIGRVDDLAWAQQHFGPDGGRT